MLPKPVRRILFLFILAGVGFYTYDVVKDHTALEVIAFKQYSAAVLDNDMLAARKLVKNDIALHPLRYREKRQDAINGDVRFVWYDIRKLKRSDTGRNTTLQVRQTIRYDPPGHDSFWGTDKIINHQFVTMEKEKSAWKVIDYRDNFYHPGMVSEEDDG